MNNGQLMHPKLSANQDETEWKTRGELLQSRVVDSVFPNARACVLVLVFSAGPEQIDELKFAGIFFFFSFALKGRKRQICPLVPCLKLQPSKQARSELGRSSELQLDPLMAGRNPSAPATDYIYLNV